MNHDEYIKKREERTESFKNLRIKRRLKKDFILRFINIRIDKNLSQKDVSKMTGLTQSVIARFESANSNPTLDTILKISEALGVELRPIEKGYEPKDLLLEIVEKNHHEEISFGKKEGEEEW